MVLKHVVLHGINGMAKLSKQLNDTWMPDIRDTQLGDALSGVAPVRGLVNFGSGVKNLVIVPMREYRKDGRIIRGVGKGVVSIATKTTKELAKFGAKVAVGTQTMLENTEEFLGGKGSGYRPSTDGEQCGGFYYLVGPGFGAGGSVASDPGEDYYYYEVAEGEEGTGGKEDRVKAISLYADQPLNVVQGLRGAGDSLRRNLRVRERRLGMCWGRWRRGGRRREWCRLWRGPHQWRY